jgi:hypothetical protein
MARIVTLAVIFTVLSVPARAQWVVHDPGNFAQALVIAERTLREYETLLAQYETIMRMGRSLPSMEGYRLSSVATGSHDASRWEYGGPWLRGLNAGDADGSAFWRTARRLERPGALLEALPPAARRAIEQAYATVEITDSVAMMGGHQVGAIRAYTGRLQHAIDGLENDVLNTLPRFHEITTILDKVAGGELIGRRQDMATNQLLSHALEQLLARSKRLRDTEVATMNMRLGGMRDGRAAGASIVRGAANDLRTWRQP